MDKKFMAILAAVVIGMVALFMLTGGKNESLSDAKFEGDPYAIQPTDHVLGDPNSRVVLIEYGDFQCPGCAAFFPALQQVKSELGDQFAFVYRHFPLTSIHPNAMAAHRAAEAAGNQGQFFAMHDLLFERQFQWNNLTPTEAAQLFESYANELSLDIERYRTDVASIDTLNRIGIDQDSARQLNLTGTPSLLLNGERITTPSSVDELRSLIQSAIDEAANADAEADETTQTEQ